MAQAELSRATWSGDALHLRCRLTTEPGSAESAPDDLEATLQLRRRSDGTTWSLPLEFATETGSGDGAAPAARSASAVLAPLDVAGGSALTTGVWHASIEVGRAGASTELPLHAAADQLSPAVVRNRPMDLRVTAAGTLALDVDQVERPVLDPVVARGITSVKLVDSTLHMRLPVHVTGRGPRIEVHLVPAKHRHERHVLRTLLTPDPDKPRGALLTAKLPSLGSATTWTVELRLERLGAGPTTSTDVVLVRRDLVIRLARSAAHRVRPDIKARNVVVRRAGTKRSRATTWQRRLRVLARPRRG
jgi:hypothetical protein